MDLHNVMRFGDIGRCALEDGGGRGDVYRHRSGRNYPWLFLRAVVSCLGQTGSLAHIVCLSGRFSDLGS
jgi:hypothetical protein